MNLQRVKTLAQSGSIELTRKMLRRMNREEKSALGYLPFFLESQVEDEDVFAHPDFAFSLSAPSIDQEMSLVCTQASDGRCVRIVGRLRMRKEETE